MRLITLTALGVYWAALFVGTHLPAGVRRLGNVDDKLLHFAAYAGLAFLLSAALTSFRRRVSALLVTFVVAAIYGGFDELSQLLVPGRQADILDWTANLSGAGIGAMAFALLLSTMSRNMDARESNTYERC